MPRRYMASLITPGTVFLKTPWWSLGAVRGVTGLAGLPLQPPQSPCSLLTGQGKRGNCIKDL